VRHEHDLAGRHQVPEQRAQHERRRAPHRARDHDPAVVQVYVPLAERHEGVEAGVVGGGDQDQVRLADEREVLGHQPLQVRLAEVARLEARREQHAVDGRRARLVEDAVGHRRRHALVGDQHDAGDRRAHVGRVRLDAVPPRAAHERTARALDAHAFLPLLALLDGAARALPHREAVLEPGAARVDDERQVAAVERQVAVGERGEEAARRIERHPVGAGPRLDPRVGGALLALVGEPEAAHQARRDADDAQEGDQRARPPEARAAARREHALGVLRSRRVAGRLEGGDVLVEEPDGLVEARGAADDAPRLPRDRRRRALDEAARCERIARAGRRREPGERDGRHRDRGLRDAHRDLVGQHRACRRRAPPLDAQVRAVPDLPVAESGRHRTAGEHVLPPVRERHEEPHRERRYGRRGAQRGAHLPVGERRPPGRRPALHLLAPGEDLRLVARMGQRVLARAGPRDDHQQQEGRSEGRARTGPQYHLPCILKHAELRHLIRGE